MAYARPALARLAAPSAASTCCTPSNFTVLGRETNITWKYCQANGPGVCVLETGFC